MKEIFEGAMVDCRRDQLWQKLLLFESRGSGPAPNLSHLEFLELISLVHHETLDKVHQILSLSLFINYNNLSSLTTGLLPSCRRALVGT